MFPFLLERRRMVFRPPDLHEARGDRHLLVWGDAPHWMVVDGDFFEFLGRLDGRTPLGAILRERPAWSAARKEVLGCVKALAGLRIIAPESRPDSRSDSVANRTARVSPGTKGRRVSIENISVNVTNRCNLHCRFCYNLPRRAPRAGVEPIAVGVEPSTAGVEPSAVDVEPRPVEAELSTSEIVAFLRSCRRHFSRRPSLSILGGEPLLEAGKVIDLARAARSLGMASLCSTNGLLVTDAFAREAADSGLEVQVSLDGHDARLHEGLRGKGTFDRTIRGIETLVRQGVHTIISLVCHDGNRPYLREFYDLALSLHVKEARFIPLKVMGGAPDSGLEPVEIADLVRDAVALFEAHPRFSALLGRDAFSILAGTCRHSARRTSCGTGIQTLFLDADGGLYPCLNLCASGFRIANIREAGFRFDETWKASRTLDSVRRLTSVESEGSPCASCAVRQWCLGGCHGETFARGGALQALPPNCADLHRSTVEMFWLLSERSSILAPGVQGSGRSEVRPC